MKQFKDLEITGPAEQLIAFVDEFSANLPTGWRRDREREAATQQEKDSWFVFIYESPAGEPPSNVFLSHDNGRLHVPNITPLKSGQLSMDQYNRIFDKFTGILRNHLPPDSTLEINVTDDIAAITDWVSPDAAKLLEIFSNSANKSTGTSHPSDFKRWVDFLIKAHKEDSRDKLDGEFLAKWLEEELGWPSKQAEDLAIEYEYALRLLQAYDRPG